jgi:hypothetical protein
LRAGSLGLLLIAAAAIAWGALVPPARARASELSHERAGIEREREALALQVAELERRLGPGRASPDAGGSGLGAVELRVAVVEALADLTPGRAIRLDVQGPDAASPGVQLVVSGELDEVLSLIEALSHPVGPLVLSRLELRPGAQDGVQLQLQALLPGTGS